MKQRFVEILGGGRGWDLQGAIKTNFESGKVWVVKGSVDWLI